jgi:hypothetical protein
MHSVTVVAMLKVSQDNHYTKDNKTQTGSITGRFILYKFVVLFSVANFTFQIN